MDDQGTPTTSTSGAGPNPGPERKPSPLALLFSGAGGAVLAVGIGAIINSGNANGHSTLVVTTTVRGPTVTQYEPLSLSEARPCSGTKVAGGPPYEPNNSIAEAYGPMKTGQPIDASLGSPHEAAPTGKDEDFYAFCIGRPATASVQLKKTGCEPETEGFSTDCSEQLHEELIDDSGHTVESAEVGETTQTTITKPLKAGRYYVRIYGGAGSEYELEVSSDGVPLQPTVP
jgi:hypothetical protein